VSSNQHPWSEIVEQVIVSSVNVVTVAVFHLKN